MSLLVKRIYEKPFAKDGIRVLVDRLWPRGMTKEAAALDLWLRELAPSNELRKSYHGDHETRASFRRLYSRELQKPKAKEALEKLAELMSRNKRVTLLFASKDLEYNNAVVLKELVEKELNP